MPVEHVQDLVAALTKRVCGADAGPTADAAVATWHEISAALSPIIGTGGVAALYKRSLHLTRPVYPWLETALPRALAPADFGALHRALSQQADTEAAAASAALIQTFCDVLARLIGPSLTVRLLRSAGGASPQTLPSQNPTPCQPTIR